MPYETQERLPRLSLPQGVTQTRMASRQASLPEGIELAFCPTGPGGGIDPTCGKGGNTVAKAAMKDVIDAADEVRFRDVGPTENALEGETNTWIIDEEDGLVDAVYNFETKSGRRFHVAIEDEELTFEDDQGSLTKTGKGEAFEIFTAVSKATLAYIQEENPPIITFSASGRGRAKLYERLAHSVAALHPKYTLKSETVENTTYFELANSEAAEDEDEDAYEDDDEYEYDDEED